LDRFRDRL